MEINFVKNAFFSLAVFKKKFFLEILREYLKIFNLSAKLRSFIIRKRLCGITADARHF